MLSPDLRRLTRNSLQRLIRRALSRWAPPPKLTTTEWGEQHRYLASETTALPGKYSSALTPWVPYIHAALDDRDTWKVVCMKSAQIAWTDGVINNWLGRIIDIDPSPVIGLFAKTGAAQEFYDEKLVPMVRATPRLRRKLPHLGAKTRKAGQRWAWTAYPGGFLKLVGSNSPSNVKSTPAPRVFVEEPDDAQINVGRQGDSIKLLEERTKTFPRRKVVFGGTPSVAGVSTIEAAFLESDQTRFWVPCHECGQHHVLAWENVTWLDDTERSPHPVYGHARPETARYTCPHCGCLWDDAAKNRNVRRLEPRRHAEFRGVAGFYLNELYSPFAGSRLERLVERYLAAERAREQGDETDAIVFMNSALGLPYAYKSDAPEADDLAARALDYPERHVPAGGLILTAGIDVQHDRLAIIIRAWGRGEESWLVLWHEIHAQGRTADKTDPVWDELEQILDAPYRHAAGGALRVCSASIDAGDGNTSDAVYAWVRRRGRGAMAIKGAAVLDKEIFSLPKKLDLNRANSKAARYGLQSWPVGTQKAKDLIDERLRLTGPGPGRMHAYAGVRSDYWDQLLGEVKAPHPSIRGRKIWQRRAGAAVEALDGEVYALHAARAIKAHVMPESRWVELERALIQPDLLGEQTPAVRSPAPGRRTRSSGITV